MYYVFRNVELDTLTNKPTILLSHYPFMSLLQGEKKVISTMLQHNGVRLWLAGHEHDHVLQKVQYISSLQAGALRKEQDVRSSVLLGQYNRLLVCVL